MEDLKFTGQSPVVINYNGSAEDIYAPLRTSSCDINIVDEHILDDLYTAKKDEIEVVIEKTSPKKDWVIKMVDPGHIESLNVQGTGEGYQCLHQTQIFTDVDRDIRFNGVIRNMDNGVSESATLKYNHSTNKWERSSDKGYTNEDQSFYGETSDFKVYYDEGEGEHKISVWDQSAEDWTFLGQYQMFVNGEYEDCDINCNNIFHTIDGDVQMVWSDANIKTAFWWDMNTMWWEEREYTEAGSASTSYATLRGDSYMRVKNRDGILVDALCVGGYTAPGVDCQQWIVQISPNEYTFERIIPISVESGLIPRVFSDLEGNVYYLDSTGKIWYWSWDVEQWCVWVTFSGGRSGTFTLDYKIPGNTSTTSEGMTKTVVIKYLDMPYEYKYFQLTNISAPTFEKVWEVIPGEYETKIIWDGYKMPNTYSQDVTQNLDSINMTAIDPVSIMKYVKIDKIITKPSVMTYGELIAKALAYVMLDSHKLRVERVVTYGSASYTGNNGLFDLKCQVSNFWDESSEPSSIYEMIEELLRPFCLTLVYVDDCYNIYNPNRTEGETVFDEYEVSPLGELIHKAESYDNCILYDFEEGDWKSNNTQNASVEIGPTYDKVTGVASTCEPSYSQMAIDIIDYNQRDNYDVFQLNVQRNKTKGYRKVNNNMIKDEEDAWFYLWNGVYVNDDYHLNSHAGLVNGYININKAYNYLTGNTGNPADYGSLLNFYGGANNPLGTGKEEPNEKSVEVKKRITAYAPDNGIPPEFLENDKLVWNFDSGYDENEGTFDPYLYKVNTQDAAFGEETGEDSNPKIVYHQDYENIALDSSSKQTLDLSLTQSYSRTGIDVPIDIYPSNTSTNNYFILEYPWEGEEFYRPMIKTSTMNYFPSLWKSQNILVNNYYFRRYQTGYNQRIREVWDRRKVAMYVKTSTNVIYQFNGKDWVQDTEVRDSNCFYLLKLMNGEHIYHTDFKYNVIETSDYDPSNPNAGGHYSLSDSNFTYHVDSHGGVMSSGGTTKYCTPYAAESNAWAQWIDSCSPGELSIVLPYIDDVSATVSVDIYNSNMLGMTGGGAPNLYIYANSIWYQVEGTGKITDYEGESSIVTLTPRLVGPIYGTIAVCPGNGARINFAPANSTHIKGEHLDLNISVSVPESNLGQMFSQSDIKYTLDEKKNYAEEFKGITFRSNTYNPLVASSYSYIIYDNNVADPTLFVINGNADRPECYTVQAYLNWLSHIRKIYSKTILPIKDNERTFSNFKTFITSPEVSENRMMVIEDNWDLKTNRHSLVAIEAQNLDVSWVYTFTAVEVPRMARAERWNLPTAYTK